jgi:hypothetical protein
MFIVLRVVAVTLFAEFVIVTFAAWLRAWSAAWLMVPVSDRDATDVSWLGASKLTLLFFIVPYSISCPAFVLAKTAI